MSSFVANVASVLSESVFCSSSLRRSVYLFPFFFCARCFRLLSVLKVCMFLCVLCSARGLGFCSCHVRSFVSLILFVFLFDLNLSIALFDVFVPMCRFSGRLFSSYVRFSSLNIFPVIFSSSSLIFRIVLFFLSSCVLLFLSSCFLFHQFLLFVYLRSVPVRAHIPFYSSRLFSSLLLSYLCLFVVLFSCLLFRIFRPFTNLIFSFIFVLITRPVYCSAPSCSFLLASVVSEIRLFSVV